VHAVAKYGQKRGAELLIASGADINAKTDDGQTPMDVALGMGYREIVEFLSSSGGDFGTKKNVGKQWIKK
jgi:ankyrin repeat protein